MDVEKESFWGPESQPRTAAEWSLWFPNDTLPASLVTHEGECNDEITAPTTRNVYEISDGEETIQNLFDIYVLKVPLHLKKKPPL